MNKVLVCPIAFNEHVKLKNAIERFLKCPLRDQVDYLVMDDGSTDGTTEMIQSYAAQGVMTLKHEVQKGVGAAIRTSFRYAQKNGYEIVVIMAGNDKDDPNELSFLIDPMIKDGYDFVQGSRYKGTNGVGGDMPFYRKIATRVHPLLMCLITGVKVTDTTNGYRAVRLSLLEDPQINLDQEWLDQYELEPYILYKALKLKYKFIEAPVTKIYPSRKLGYTKMKPFIGWWSILRPLVYLGLGLRK